MPRHDDFNIWQSAVFAIDGETSRLRVSREVHWPVGLFDPSTISVQGPTHSQD